MFKKLRSYIALLASRCVGDMPSNCRKQSLVAFKFVKLLNEDRNTDIRNQCMSVI